MSMDGIEGLFRINEFYIHCSLPFIYLFYDVSQNEDMFYCSSSIRRSRQEKWHIVIRWIILTLVRSPPRNEFQIYNLELNINGGQINGLYYL